MKITVAVFGLPLVTISVSDNVHSAYEAEFSEPTFEGGSAHNFERDYDPLSATSHHEWEWEDRKKGFGFR